MASPSVLLDWAAPCFEGPVLSPLRESPLLSKDDSNFRYLEDLPDSHIPCNNTATKSAEEETPPILKKDIVLKNAESWAKLVKQSVAPAAIKSSKESFQQFRKAAIEKEEREKSLKKKQVEENKEGEKISLSGPCKTEANSQLAKKDPDSSEQVCTEATSDPPKDDEEQQPKSPIETQPATTQSEVDTLREMARRKEQERRRREALSGIDMTMQRDVMTAFELSLD